MLAAGPDHSMALDHNHIITVTELWQSVKKVETYKDDFPEQCILRMLELDPATRTNLRLPSFRHARYGVVSNAIIKIIEDILSVLGPDLEEFIEEICAVGELCAQEGLNPKLLGKTGDPFVDTFSSQVERGDSLCRCNTISPLDNIIISACPPVHHAQG